MKVLITGSSGLAGAHLVRACADAGDEVIAVSRSGGEPGTYAGGPADPWRAAVRARRLDLGDADATRALVAEERPEVIYHLAAQSSVGLSWEQPSATIQENVTTAVNLLEAIRHEAPDAHVVWASTCEVYGPAEVMPIDESAPLKPVNPYAVSKVTGDLLCAVYVEAYGISVIRARPFNHAGPGQRAQFILSSLAEQGARAQVEGRDSIQILTGNPNTRRDFTDARDVARAYRLLADLDRPGAVFNVCSGVSVSAAEHVALLAELIAPIEVEHVVDPSRVRAHEVMEIRGSPAAIAEATGWERVIPLRQTMDDTLAWWREQIEQGAAA